AARVRGAGAARAAPAGERQGPDHRRRRGAARAGRARDRRGGGLDRRRAARRAPRRLPARDRLRALADWARGRRARGARGGEGAGLRRGRRGRARAARGGAGAGARAHRAGSRERGRSLASGEAVNPNPRPPGRAQRRIQVMRRRFGRGRRNRNEGEARGSIDAARWPERIAATGLVAGALEPVAAEDVPDTLAVLYASDGESGRVLVAFSPTHGGDAALAALAVGQRWAASGGLAEAIALAPEWSGAARRR